MESDQPPVEKVVVFDEAQRAWTLAQTERFMKDKKGIIDFDMSEPEFLIGVMDRHNDYAVVVCLIGGGRPPPSFGPLVNVLREALARAGLPRR